VLAEELLTPIEASIDCQLALKPLLEGVLAVDTVVMLRPISAPVTMP
jgi:hypothetical protein